MLFIIFNEINFKSYAYSLTRFKCLKKVNSITILSSYPAVGVCESWLVCVRVLGGVCESWLVCVSPSWCV